MGKGGGVGGWRVQIPSLESEKDAKCFPPNKIIRNLSGSCHGGEVCGRDGTHPRLQAFILFAVTVVGKKNILYIKNRRRHKWDSFKIYNST